MAAGSSFISHVGGRPPRYRTPSPPRRAVEPISPSLHYHDQASWNAQSSLEPSKPDLEITLKDGNTHLPTNGGSYRPSPESRQQPSHPRSGHGRSGSTIDTLATIALATSPTFTPASVVSQSQKSDKVGDSPVSERRESDERPAKRMRADENDSHILGERNARPTASHQSHLDSLKGDAELLLNFARPSNFAPIPPIRKTEPSFNGSALPRYASESKWNSKSRPAAMTQNGTHHDFVLSPSPNNIFSPSRIRSHSDGAAAIARPLIPGLRPNTSSSNLPSIAWDADDANHVGKYSLGGPTDLNYPRSTPRHASIGEARLSLPSVAKEEADESDDSSQASCAACHLNRMNGDGEDQSEVTWINCDGCKRWFHIVCAGFKNDREVRTVDRFICRECRPVHGQTTFVRKSSRARTAIDYAGLNQGLIKTATDSAEHHYIQPIKEGKIQFLPEAFPRMRPELVTAEFFERGIGMTEPIVIPAAYNPRTSTTTVENECIDLLCDAPTEEMFNDFLENLPDLGNGVEEVVVDCGQDLLDMVVPQGLTVRTVAELYGPEERVEVIDVKSQQGEEKKWNMQKWADYYESTGPKPVRNVISLEVSQSRLGKLIRRPKIVRDLDLQDAVWPTDLRAVGDYPKVQFYCLMSVADCYTDFHIDFGGSSVYYTILKGKKTFFFIPPKEKHLKKYEEWCNSPAQDTTFLGDQTKECYRVDLEEGDTMLIPAGWIHAVWTPENSLVIGGNFLTRMNYGMQIKVAKIEKDTKVPRKFRYPFFQKIQWYTAMKYLEEDPIPKHVLDSFGRDEHYRFYRTIPIYYEFGERFNNVARGTSYFNARFYSQAELEGLPELTKYLLRTALIAGGYPVDGVNLEMRNAVKRSIPKLSGDPIDFVKKFAIWVAWKRGNEHAPHWTRPGAINENFKIDQHEKRPAGRPSRRSERHADAQRMYAERQGLQRLSEHMQDTFTSLQETPPMRPEAVPPAPIRASSPEPNIKDEAPKPRAPPKASGLGPKRVACDACRKRRIRCRHKDEPNDGNLMQSSMPKPMLNSFDPELQNSSVLAHDAASVLNSLASMASETPFHDVGGGLGISHFERHPGDAARSNFVESLQNGTINQVDHSPQGGGSAKKGRSKACDECRKSKRRCIHDEYGRIDPIKAQERSKPRASSTNKRPRLSDEGPVQTWPKKQKHDVPFNITDTGNYHHGQDMVINGITSTANGFMMDDSAHQFSIDMQAPLAEQAREALNLSQQSYASPPAGKVDTNPEVLVAPALSNEPPTALVSPPTSLSGELEVPISERANVDMYRSVEGEHDGEHPPVLHTPKSSSRHSSRQPRQIMDRTIPEVPVASKVNKSSTTRPLSRSSPKSVSAPSSMIKKPQSRPTSSHASKKSVSPSVEKKTALSTSPRIHGKHVKKDRASFGEIDADEESLRLIRELQEQDFGLRRRAARV